MRKIFLCLYIVCFMLCGVSYADASTDTFVESFIGIPEGSVKPSMFLADDSLQVIMADNVVVEDMSDFNGKVLTVNADGEMKLTGKNFEDAFTVAFDFYQHDAGNIECLYSAEQINKCGPKLQTKNGKFVVTNGVEEYTGSAYEAGRWYNIKINVDVINSVYSFYVNGTRVGTEFSFSGIDEITVPFYTKNGTDVSYSLDNIKIYSDIPGDFCIAEDDFSGYERDKQYVPNQAGQTLAGLELLYNDTRPANLYVDSENEKLVMNSETAQAIFIGYAEVTGTEVTAEFDFMQPVKSDIETLYRCTNRDGTQYGVWLRSRNNNIITYNGTTETILISSYEAGKTYRFRIHTDIEAETFDVYVDGICVGEDLALRTDVNNKDQGDLTTLGRVFMSELKVGQKEFYFDNIKMYVNDNVKINSQSYEEFDELISDSRELISLSEKGTTDGKYPDSAFVMLKDSYKNAKIKSESVLEPEQISAETERIRAAIELFESSKIDTSLQDATEINHIEVSFDKYLYFNGGAGYEKTLDAEVYSRDGNLIDEPVFWTLESASENVSIVDGKLVIAPNTNFEEFVLKAQSGDIYTKISVMAFSKAKISVTEFNPVENTLVVRSTLDKQTIFPIYATLTGETLNYSTVLFPDNNQILWTEDIPDGTGEQDLTLTLTGDDILTVTLTKKYYGSNWKQDCVTLFNNAPNDSSAQGIGALVMEYSSLLGGLELDDELYQKYSDKYNERVYNYKPYSEFEDINDVIVEANYIISFADATRANVEGLIVDNLAYLENNGFNKANYLTLSYDEVWKFYLNSLDFEIDCADTTIVELITKFNKIVTDIIDNRGSLKDTPSTSRTGFSPKNPSYQASATVENKTDKEEEKLVLKEVEPFIDIEEASWAKEALLYLKTRDIMVGYNNEVRPNDYITRGECAKLIAVAFDLTENNNIVFSDSADNWWSIYASILATANVTNGYSDGKFGGNDNITREMLAVMINRVLETKEIQLYEKNLGKEFADSSAISDYAKAAVEQLYIKGVVSGIGNNLFAPKLNVTRAEAAQIIYNVLKETEV